MDPAAIAETAVEMWCLIDAKLIARKQTMLDPVVQAQIFSESMKLYMTNIINAARSTAPGAAPQTDVRPPTDKQLSFIKDLGGDPSTVHSSAEASKLIEELKK